MARNLGFLGRQLLGIGNRNRNQPCPNCIRFLTTTTSNSTQESEPPSIGGDIIQSCPPSRVRAPFKPFKLPFLPYDLSVRTPCFPNLSENVGLSRGPPNVVFITYHNLYCDTLKKVQDERISAVFFFTSQFCRSTKRWIYPLLNQLCEEFRHLTIYLVYMDQNGGRTLGSTLHRLGVFKTPTFHFYLKGEKVDEFASASVPRLKKTLANVYNPSGMKKKRRPRAKKDKDDGFDKSLLFELLPTKFPATSAPKVMQTVETLPGANPLSELWWFAKGLLSSQEKRELFCRIKEPDLQLEWLILEWLILEQAEE